MERILIIEDEEKLARFLELEVEYEGYQIEKAFDGREGLALAKACPFDLILLDIMLPGINGIEVLRRIRQFSQVPVILLTARDTVVDKVTGLDSGADDYVTKPFAIEELLARIRTSLRKSKSPDSARHSVPVGAGVLKLDAVSRECWVGGNRWNSQKEFDLLYCLIQNKNIVMNRDCCLSVYGVMISTEEATPWMYTSVISGQR